MANTIGLQMFTLRREMAETKKPAEIYAKIKAAGYDAIQGGISHKMAPGEFKKLLDDAGLKPISFTGKDFGQLSGLEFNLKGAIEGAQALGVKQLDIGSIHVEDRSSADGYKYFAKQINRVGKPLAKEGIRLSYHHHSFEFHKFDGLTGLEILVNETDPEVLNFCLDTHWLVGGGAQPASWIKKLSGRMSMIHFKDYGVPIFNEHRFWINGKQMEMIPSQFEAVGEGNIDWEPIVAACKDAKIDIFVVEQDDQQRDVYDSIASSANYMKKTLKL